MKIFKYLFAIWTGIAVYTLFSFLGGPKGLASYNYLLSEKELQLANIKELGVINEDLEKSRNNLLYDRDTLMVHARNMGYGQENERFIRIVGFTAQTALSGGRPTPAITGNVYIAHKPEHLSEFSIKIAAICAALLVFAFLLMLEIIESKVK